MQRSSIVLLAHSHFLFSAGWLPGTDASLSAPRCTIPRAPAKSLPFVLGDEPLIIMDLERANELFRDLTVRDALLESYRASEVLLSSSNTYSYKKKTMVLEDYLKHMREAEGNGERGDEVFYLFGNNNYTEFAPLFREYGDMSWLHFFLKK